MTAGEVMDLAAVLLNDAAKTRFTYAVQIPYLNMAMAELQEYFELHNIAATNKTTSPPITLTPPATTIATPADLIEIQQLWERQSGTNDDYTPMTRRDFLPKIEVLSSALVFWSWNEQTFQFLGATSVRQIKIDYIKSLFVTITAAADTIDLINSKTFLFYRTAGLVARFIGENPSRGEELDAFAALAIDRATGINVKATQSVATRRRPFRASYKTRGW